MVGVFKQVNLWVRGIALVASVVSASLHLAPHQALAQASSDLASFVAVDGPGLDLPPQSFSPGQDPATRLLERQRRQRVDTSTSTGAPPPAASLPGLSGFTGPLRTEVVNPASEYCDGTSNSGRNRRDIEAVGRHLARAQGQQPQEGQPDRPARSPAQERREQDRQNLTTESQMDADEDPMGVQGAPEGSRFGAAPQGQAPANYRVPDANLGDAELNQMAQRYSNSPQVRRMISAMQARAGGSQGLCYRYVKQGLLAGGLVNQYLPGGSAFMAGPHLQRQGFRNILNSVRGDPRRAPVGAVLVYDGGPHGHIEVRTPNGFVSDYQSANPRTGGAGQGRGRRLIGVYIHPNPGNPGGR